MYQWPGLAPSRKCAFVHFVLSQKNSPHSRVLYPRFRTRMTGARAVTPAPDREPDREPDWEPDIGACLVRKAVRVLYKSARSQRVYPRSAHPSAATMEPLSFSTPASNFTVRTRPRRFRGRVLVS